MKIKQSNFLTLVFLSGIVLFSIYIRYEDFNSWKKNPALFTFHNEYQMANADCHYYLQHAKDLAQNRYQGIDSLRWVPAGKARPVIAPLLSYVTYWIHVLFSIPLDRIAAFLPIFLSSLLALVVYLYLRFFQVSVWASLTGAYLSIISLTYVYRTRIGVFDTDCLNAVLMLLNSYLFLRWVHSSDSQKKWFLGSIILHFILFLWWWNTAQSVVAISFLYTLFIAVIFYSPSFSPVKKIGILTLVFIPILGLVHKDFFDLISLVLGFKNQFPIVAEVSELTPVSWKEFVEKTSGHALPIIAMILGLIYMIIQHKKLNLFLLIPFLLAFIPFYSGNRFLLFSATILAIGAGFLLDFIEKRAQPWKFFSYIFGGLILVITTIKNYPTITHKYTKLAAYDYIPMLQSIEKNTPSEALVLTDWDIGYLIRYYLNRGTFADGEITGKGDILYYTSFPLAQPDLACAAHFIHFYTQNPAGFHSFVTKSTSRAQAMSFLQELYALPSDKAEEYIRGQFFKLSDEVQKQIAHPDHAMKYFFPTVKKDVYLLLHQQMLQTVFWFKQGNLDLTNFQTIGLPMYLQVYDLKQEGAFLKSPTMMVNTQDGTCLYMNSMQQAFSQIVTQLPDTQYTMSYPKAPPQSFVFHWNASMGFGAALSKEMSRSTFHQLFLLHKKSKYFTPIDLQSPLYQLWKVEQVI